MALPVDLGTIAAQNNQRQEGVLPQNQVAMFLGPNAQNRDPMMETLAKAMEAEGRDPNEIYRSTGLFRNPINQSLTSYVPDYATKMDPKVIARATDPENIAREAQPKVTLGDLIPGRKDLFAAYPRLQDVPVTFSNNPYTLGAYNDRSNSMELSLNPTAANIFGYKGYSIADNPFINATLVHEIQHAIQNYEGDPNRGVNTGGDEYSGVRLFQDLARSYAAKLNELPQDVPAPYTELGIPAYEPPRQPYTYSDPYVQQMARTAFTNYLQGKGVQVPEETNFNISSNNFNYDPNGIGMEIYNRLSGEKQSRATENMYLQGMPKVNPLAGKPVKTGSKIGEADFLPTFPELLSGMPYSSQINAVDMKNMPLSAGFNQPQAPKVIPQSMLDLMASVRQEIPVRRPEINPYTGYAKSMEPSSDNRRGSDGGGLDRSGPSMADTGSSNNSAGSGGNQGSFGGRGSFATSPRSEGAFSSSYNARERRGGRIG